MEDIQSILAMAAMQVNHYPPPPNKNNAVGSREPMRSATHVEPLCSRADALPPAQVSIV